MHGLKPYGRALVLHEAEIIWDEQCADAPTEIQEQEAEEDTVAIVLQWLGSVLRRLSPESRVTLIELARSLDDAERFQRLAGGVDQGF